MPASAMYLYGRLAKIQKAGLGGDPSGAKGAEGPTDLKAVVAAARMASEEEAAAIAALEPHNPARDVLDDTRGWRQKARAMMHDARGLALLALRYRWGRASRRPSYA
jgi:hypothetical protein